MTKSSCIKSKLMILKSIKKQRGKKDWIIVESRRKKKVLKRPKAAMKMKRAKKKLMVLRKIRKRKKLRKLSMRL